MPRLTMACISLASTVNSEYIPVVSSSVVEDIRRSRIRMIGVETSFSTPVSIPTPGWALPNGVSRRHNANCPRRTSPPVVNALADSASIIARHRAQVGEVVVFPHPAICIPRPHAVCIESRNCFSAGAMIKVVIITMWVFAIRVGAIRVSASVGSLTYTQQYARLGGWILPLLGSETAALRDLLEGRLRAKLSSRGFRHQGVSVDRFSASGDESGEGEQGGGASNHGCFVCSPC